MLKRRWIINLALVAVALGLALAARLEHDRERLATTLTAMQPEAIQGLTLQRPGEPLIRMVRNDDSGWRMLEPFSAPAASLAIGKLLSISATVVHRSIPAAAADLSQLRLDPPLISLRLDDLELRIGTTEPVDERRYIQIGDMVHLIDDGYLPQLLASAEHYLDRRLLPTGFSPMLGTIDGRPLGTAAVAGLADAEAIRVEPLTGQLGGRLVTLAPADGGKTLRFLVDEGGTRWSRLDQRLSYLFASPPLTEVNEDMTSDDMTAGLPGPFELLPPSQPINQSDFESISDGDLLELRAPTEPATKELLPAPASTPMPTEKLTP